MIDYLWKITREAENNEESGEDDSNHNNRGKNWRKDRKRFNREGKYNKGARDRSRSYSKERPPSKYDHENYPNFLPMKGFYAPKGRFGAPMMPMGSLSSSLHDATNDEKVRNNPIFFIFDFLHTKYYFLSLKK